MSEDRIGELDQLYFKLAKLIETWLESIEDRDHDDWDLVPQLMLDEIKYAKHFYTRTTGSLIDKVKVGFMLLKTYQRLERKCNSRREVRADLFANLMAVVKYGPDTLDPEFIAQLNDYVKN